MEGVPKQTMSQNNTVSMIQVLFRELAPGTVSLTGDRVQGDDSKQNSYYRVGKCATYQ